MEVWKGIPGFPQYEASNLGRVRSLNYRAQGTVHILKPAQAQSTTYYTLSNNGYQKKMSTHRVIYMTFNEIPDNYEDMIVLHKDRDCTNNRADNLILVEQNSKLRKRKPQVITFHSGQPTNSQVKEDKRIQEFEDWAIDKDIPYENQNRYLLFDLGNDKRLFMSHVNKNVLVWYLGSGKNSLEGQLSQFKTPEQIYEWAKHS